ncbi:hypothetical protein Tco_1236298 [Tanacetum coccineum]
MAGSLPKTIPFNDSLSSDEDSFILIDDSLYLFAYHGPLRRQAMDIEVFGYILLVLKLKRDGNLKVTESPFKFRGGLLGILEFMKD